MTTNKMYLAGAFCILLLGACACNPVVDKKAESDKIVQLNNDWAAYIKAGDAVKIADLFAEKYVSMYRGEPMYRVRADVSKSLEGFLTDPLVRESFKGTADTVEIGSSGDLAWSGGLYSYSYNSPAGPMKFDGKTLTLWRKIGGQWKVIMDIGTEVNPATAPYSSPELVAEFRKVEEGWNDATYKKDIKALDQLLAAEYTYADELVDWTSKQVMLDEVASGVYKYTAPAVLGDIKVNVYGNVAVVKGINKLKGTFKGKDITGTYHFVDVFVWRDGRWQCVSTK